MSEALFLSRLVLAGVFAISAIAKLFDYAGSRKSMSDFGVPGPLAGAAARLLPLAELVCVIALLLNSWAWLGAVGIAVMLIIFTAGISVNLARGRKPNCHCFGQLSSTPVSWKTLVRNGALLALSLLIVWQGKENPGTWPSLPAFAGVQSILLGTVGLLLVVCGLAVWILLHMLRQNGRLLVRLEAVEKKLNIDPNAAEVPGLPAGQPAPSFELAQLDGEHYSLEELLKPGLSLLLVFVEPACGACEDLQPKLAEWQREYSDRIQIVPVSRGHLEANRDRSKRYGVSGVLMQKDREVWNSYLVRATPSAVLIKEGKVASPLAEGPEAIQDLVRRSTLPPPAKKGDPIPALKLPDLDGETVDLGALRGRRTLLLFWNPGCGFCQRMLDDIKDWEQRRSEDDPELLVISSGTPDANRAQGFRSRVLLDTGWGAGSVLGAGGTPSALVVDESGTVASEVAVGKPAVMSLAGVDPTE
jgi:peroxiredoxin/uncharacterized membrane protein YphA (DoxX/SURF4 family)